MKKNGQERRSSVYLRYPSGSNPQITSEYKSVDWKKIDFVILLVFDCLDASNAVLEIAGYLKVYAIMYLTNM
jgi:hypothetical protein